MEYDKRIDKGEKLFELDPELEKGAKKARRADRTDTPKPRERKPNPDKAIIIEQLMNAIGNAPVNAQCEVLNPEREFLFIYNGIKYKVTLACPRG